jgi:hypothetical protein
MNTQQQQQQIDISQYITEVPRKVYRHRSGSGFGWQEMPYDTPYEAALNDFYLHRDTCDVYDCIHSIDDEIELLKREDEADEKVSKRIAVLSEAMGYLAPLLECGEKAAVVVYDEDFDLITESDWAVSTNDAITYEFERESDWMDRAQERMDEDEAMVTTVSGNKVIYLH